MASLVEPALNLFQGHSLVHSIFIAAWCENLMDNSLAELQNDGKPTFISFTVLYSFPLIQNFNLPYNLYLNTAFSTQYI